MSLGPGGKYDKECEELAEKLEAEATLLMVGGGSRGSGFSMTIRAKTRHPLTILQATVLVLEDTARQVRADIARLEHEMAKQRKEKKD